jgi:peptide/nickel transport system ATP-binding protein
LKVLCIDGLRKIFKSGGRKKVAVHGFSARVEQGQIMAIVGESGSGKSTIARMILGLERADAGLVTIQQGPEIETPSFHHVQMIFQDPFASLNPVHTVRRHLARPILKLRDDVVGRGGVEAEIHRLLRLVELVPTADFVDRFPDSLSGGERQRVAIARALAADPTFLVADEPTSMLDVSIRQGILHLLLTLRNEGMGVLLITHDLNSVDAVADYVCVLKDGVCVEHGHTDRVLRAAEHHYTQLLIASVPDAAGAFLEDFKVDDDRAML